MKNKISPEDYSAILMALVLDKICLTNANLKVYSNIPNGGNIELDFNDKYKFVDEDKFVRFIASFTLDGKISENDNVVKLFTVSGDYSVVYYKQSDVVVTKEFFDVFKELSLSTIVWPYFREYIQNMVSRTGLPPFVLPSKIIAKSKKD